MAARTWLHSPIFHREQGRSELHDSLLVGRDCCAHLFADTLLCADAVKRCLHSTGRDLEPGSHDVLQADQLPTHHLQRAARHEHRNVEVLATSHSLGCADVLVAELSIGSRLGLGAVAVEDDRLRATLNADDDRDSFACNTCAVKSQTITGRVRVRGATTMILSIKTKCIF